MFEAIDYSTRETAKDVVLAWLIDDGVPKRSNRLNLLSKENAYCALASGSHITAESCTVSMFAA